MDTFKLKYELPTILRIDKELLKEKNGKLLLDIEGKLEIWIEQGCFLVEPSLALLELGVGLTRWKERVEETQESFYHYTMEHDEREGPILAFINNGANKWSLSSIWQEFEHKGYLSLINVLEEVDLFLINFEREIIKKFGIRLDDFLCS